MALRASALKGAVVAAICVALLASWVGEPAQAGSPSCAFHHCISECPSRCNEKAARSCESAKGADVSKCRNGCVSGCNASCRDRVATTSCDCDNVCESYCKTTPGPTYNACFSAVFQWCKDSCEKACKGENRPESSYRVYGLGPLLNYCFQSRYLNYAFGHVAEAKSSNWIANKAS
ncbi:hypothetical protein BDA96_08G069500 [Sorghum bicolor]|uniref:Uncharacterized protein n=1 Tax=Sorghum bicolor TaxID=4558 RepID=A0A921QG87_SORBI|nr:hypothetical protein BDA96_08G069500 [Sorghum bicolor]